MSSECRRSVIQIVIAVQDSWLVAMAERNYFPLPRGPCQKASEGRSCTWWLGIVSGAEWPTHTGLSGIRTLVYYLTQSASSMLALGGQLRPDSISSGIFVFTADSKDLAGKLIVDYQWRRGFELIGPRLALEPEPDLQDGSQVSLIGLLKQRKDKPVPPGDPFLVFLVETGLKQGRVAREVNVLSALGQVAVFIFTLAAALRLCLVGRLKTEATGPVRTKLWKLDHITITCVATLIGHSRCRRFSTVSES